MRLIIQGVFLNWLPLKMSVHPVQYISYETQHPCHPHILTRNVEGVF